MTTQHTLATLSESRGRWPYTRSVLSKGVVPKGATVEVCAVSGACFVRTVDPRKIIVFMRDEHCVFAMLHDAPAHWS